MNRSRRNRAGRRKVRVTGQDRSARGLNRRGGYGADMDRKEEETSGGKKKGEVRTEQNRRG